MRNIIIIIIISATFFSCIKPIDFDDQGLANQLVLNSIICPDSVFSASLFKSTSILTDKRVGQSIDGTLDFYENGNLLATMSSAKGQFSDVNIKPKMGSTYRIVVTANGKQAEAETIIPNKSEIVSIDTLTTTDEYKWKKMNFKLKIKDQPGEDFYRIIIIREALKMEYNSNRPEINKYYLEKTQVSIESDDPVFNSLFNNFGGEVMNMGPSNNDFIFPDDYFQNKEYSIKFQDNTYFQNQFQEYSYIDPSNPNIYSGRKCIYERNTIHLLKLSKELFNYMKYMVLYNHYHDDPFAEPVPVFSNIKNGVGIFASFNDDTKITFEDIHTPYSMDTIKIEDHYSNY